MTFDLIKVHDPKNPGGFILSRPEWIAERGYTQFDQALPKPAATPKAAEPAASKAAPKRTRRKAS